MVMMFVATRCSYTKRMTQIVESFVCGTRKTARYPRGFVQRVVVVSGRSQSTVRAVLAGRVVSAPVTEAIRRVTGEYEHGASKSREAAKLQ